MVQTTPNPATRPVADAASVKLESEFQIDKSRVYVTGASAGALMGYRLACDLANRIAAFASITGSMYWNDCQPARPISILEMRGTADTHLPYDGGRSTRNNKILPAVTTVNQRWLGLDGCTGEPVLSQKGITKTSLWKGCSGGTMVRLDTIVGGHHTWFGSNFDPVPGEPDSNTEVWNFLRQFVLADAATQRYLTLVQDYWNGLQAADIVVNGSNVAAKVCLGNASPTAPTNLSLIDPATCRQRATAILAVQEKFLSDLDATPAPPRFAVDDRVFRTQIPKAISDVKAIIAACATGNKQTIRDASTAYVDDMIPTVSGALDDVDPTAVHM